MKNEQINILEADKAATTDNAKKMNLIILQITTYTFALATWARKMCAVSFFTFMWLAPVTALSSQKKLLGANVQSANSEIKEPNWYTWQLTANGHND